MGKAITTGEQTLILSQPNYQWRTVSTCTSIYLFPGYVGWRNLHSGGFHPPDFSGVFTYCSVTGELARAGNVLDDFLGPFPEVLQRRYQHVRKENIQYRYT